MKSICREVEGRWCTECCEGRNCNNFEELQDGSWGCTTHPNKPDYCTEADCLKDLNVSKKEALKILNLLPKGEFFASLTFKKYFLYI